MIKKKYIYITNNKIINLSLDKGNKLLYIKNLINESLNNNLLLLKINSISKKNINVLKDINKLFFKDYKDIHILKWAIKKKLKENLRGYCLIFNLIGLGFTMTI
jgi:hypothetical protein